MLILNIDDDIDDREMFRSAIETLDSMITCIQMESGIKALEFIAKAKILPDYIFVDINMPKMNGFECVMRIRSLPEMKKIPIVMLSTTFNPTHQFDFKKLGIKYLNKSPRFIELVENIRSLISSEVTA